MATFDFITSEELRESLETDSEELIACMKAGAWKAVYILAGSMIHSALIDFLSASEKGTQNELLALSFGELLDLCRERQVLSPRALDLSGFVRPYLSLVQPGSRRGGREIADENGAKIAQALVEIVVTELAARARQTHGSTAEQIVSKLQSDRAARTIIGHILKKTSSHELERLLIKVIPKVYFGLLQAREPEARENLADLEICFRAGVDIAPEELKRKVARRFLSVLEEESEYTIQHYETRFFRGSDLRYLGDEERGVVKRHFLASLGKSVSIPLVNAAAGIGAFLGSEQEARAFFVPLVLHMLGSEDEETHAAILKRVAEEYRLTPDQNRRHIRNWIWRMQQSLQEEGQAPKAGLLERLEASLGKPS